ncbi:hypothetical protein VPHD51_0055 [Vibrio phage D51]
MRRLQKKRLMYTMAAAVTEIQDRKNHVGVDFSAVRLLAKRSRTAYMEGSYTEVHVNPQTAFFIKDQLPRVLEEYWGLHENEYSIYDYVVVPVQENRVQVVFHKLC